MQLLTAINAGLRSKAPIIAVPIEGKAPIAFKAKNLKAALKGVTILEVTPLANDNGTSWGIHIKGRAGERVRTSVKIKATSRAEAIQVNRKWAANERDKRMKVIAQGSLSTVEQKRMKREAIEREAIAELNRDRIQAQQTKQHIARVPLGQSLVLHTEQRANVIAAYAAWKLAKRARGREGNATRRMDKLRETIFAMTGRKQERHTRRSAEVWKGRKRKLAAPDAGKLIATVQQVQRLREKLRNIRASWPAKRTDHGHTWNIGTTKPVVHDYYSAMPVYAPERGTFDRSRWEDKRKHRATLLQAALAVLRAKPQYIEDDHPLALAA